MRSLYVKRLTCLSRYHVTAHNVRLLPAHPQLFTTYTRVSKKDLLPPRPKVPERETYKSYLKGSGPGGQKINKTSSAVQLTHLPTGIVVKSQATRSRTQNESIARRILAEKVELLEKGKESRVEKKREWESKKRRSGEKKRRRKYRKLAEEREREQGGGRSELAADSGRGEQTRSADVLASPGTTVATRSPIKRDDLRIDDGGCDEERDETRPLHDADDDVGEEVVDERTNSR